MLNCDAIHSFILQQINMYNTINYLNIYPMCKPSTFHLIQISAD